jgi:hypothetical protein
MFLVGMVPTETAKCIKEFHIHENLQVQYQFPRTIILRAYLSEISFLLISLSEMDVTPPSSLPEFSSILQRKGYLIIHFLAAPLFN